MSWRNASIAELQLSFATMLQNVFRLPLAQTCRLQWLNWKRDIVVQMESKLFSAIRRGHLSIYQYEIGQELPILFTYGQPIQIQLNCNWYCYLIQRMKWHFYTHTFMWREISFPIQLFSLSRSLSLPPSLARSLSLSLSHQHAHVLTSNMHVPCINKPTNQPARLSAKQPSERFLWHLNFKSFQLWIFRARLSLCDYLLSLIRSIDWVHSK